MNALTRMTSRPSRFVLGWFLMAVTAVAIATLFSLYLAMLVGRPGPRVLPAAFVASTVLLAAASAGLAKAEGFAKREKQTKLKSALTASLGSAVLFLAVQGTALSALLRQIDPDDAAIGPRSFVFVATALHALHVAAAVLWLVSVTIRGFAGEYDHEYRFGLTACGWCWHALGIVWLAILAAFVMAV